MCPAAVYRAQPANLYVHQVCFTLVSLPMVLGFEVVMRSSSAEALRAANAAVDALLLLDVLVSFRTAFFQEGLLVSDPRSIARHYARTALLADLLGACPLSLVQAFATSPLAVPGWLPAFFGAVRVSRFPRLLASVMVLWPTAARPGTIPGVLRLARLVSLFVLVCHWVACAPYQPLAQTKPRLSPIATNPNPKPNPNAHKVACGWYAVALHSTDASDAAAAAAAAAADGSPLGFDEQGFGPTVLQRSWPFALQYGYAFFWAVSLLTGIVPRDVNPDTVLEVTFTVGTMLTGVALLALVCSYTTQLVSND